MELDVNLAIGGVFMLPLLFGLVEFFKNVFNLDGKVVTVMSAGPTSPAGVTISMPMGLRMRTSVTWTALPPTVTSTGARNPLPDNATFVPPRNEPWSGAAPDRESTIGGGPSPSTLAAASGTGTSPSAA